MTATLTRPVQHTFAQHSEGVCCLPVIPGSHHCGLTDDDHIRFEWSVTLHYCKDARHNPLDANGFLLDNLFLSEYFRQLEVGAPIALSCEELAMKCEEDIISALGDRGNSCLDVDVRLSPFAGTFIDYCEDFHQAVADDDGMVNYQ